MYGGYIGMAGNWARWSGCGGNIAWSSANSAAANTNYNKYGKGIGTGVYWFMGGPGVDPHYNGTTSEASSWGAAQAAKTLKAMGSLKVTYKIVWLDIELPGIKPALDNGWNNVYTSPCSGRIKTAGIAAAVDRAEVNGYEAYLTAHSSYVPGVYSSPSIWGSIFGTGSASNISGTYEWTYTNGDQQALQAPGQVVRPRHDHLRPLLRRGEPVLQAGRDVAVVRRRWRHQRHRRLRPDRYQHRQVTPAARPTATRAGAGPAGHPARAARSSCPRGEVSPRRPRRGPAFP